MSEVDATDLVCRARRESLSADERRLLERLLRTSLEVQLTSAVLRELDHESRVRRGDEALVGRMAARTTLRLGRARRRRVLRPRLLLAALPVLVAGVAAAALWVHPRAADDARSAAPQSTHSAVHTPSAPSGRSIKPTAEAVVEARADVEPNAGVEPEPNVSVGHAAAPRNRPAANTAGELFARANLLRRDGQHAEAMRLYRAVVDRYPKAREASPARLALAKLQQRRSPQQALALYQSLASSGGRLRAEGLWGVAECARQLGRTAAERHALSALAQEFSDSPYAEVARRRLQDASP